MIREAGQGRMKAGTWARRALQGAVLLAVGATLTSLSWGARGGVAGGAGAGGGGVQIGNVAAGSATMTQQGSLTTIQTGSHRTIINFQRLTVGAGETLQFVQPSARSAVLGRISGSEPTQIDGALLSNGRIYLVNPSGVMFGNGAVINVSGLYAAAGHISDADFLAGNNHFTQNTGSVTNYGTIQAGEVHLVGQSVANFGQIIAGPAVAGGNGGGIVTLTAGQDVYIGESTSPTGETSVLVRVSTPATGAAAQAGTGVTNAGTIDAGAKGSLHLGAGDLYAAGIYNSGTLRAGGGGITLDSGKNTNINTGVIDASSDAGRGGKVAMLGDKVGVFGGTVTASGKTGGGEVLIGGDAHGGGGVAVSGSAIVAQGAQVHADATATGNGGKVVVYSSGYTQVDGAISTLNGAGGHGGFVETSGEVLGVTHAPQIGLGGSWLLDPIDVTIAKNPAAGQTVSGSSGGGTTTFDPDATHIFVDSDAIGTALQSGDVTITTGSSGSDTGNITWNSGADLSYNNNRLSTLTLNAAGSIFLNAKINNAGATDHLNLALNSGAGGISVADSIDTNGGYLHTAGGTFSLAAGKSITTAGGEISLLQTGVITLNTDTVLNSGGGDITLRGSDAVLATGANATSINAGAGTAYFFASDPTSAINIGGAGGFNLTTAEIGTAIQTSQNVVIGKAGEQSGAITWDPGAGWSYDVTPTAAGRIGGLRLNTSGTISMGGTLDPASASIDGLNLTLAGGSVNVSAALNVNNGAFFAAGSTFTSSADIVSTTEINLLQTGAVALNGGTLNAGAGGTVRISGSTITESGGSIITSKLAVRATDDVTLNGSNTLDSFGAVNTGAGKQVQLTTSGAFNLDTVAGASSPTGLPAFATVSGIQTSGGDVGLFAGGTLTLSNAISAKDVTLASSGDIEGSGLVSGANLSLTAAGGIGLVTAPDLAPTGGVSLSSGGGGAAGNIAVSFFTAGSPGTLTTSQLASITTDGGTAQTVSLGVNGGVTINSALSIAGDTLAISATGVINGDGVSGHFLQAPTLQLSAAGIGTTTAVDLRPGSSAVVTTTGSGSAGNVVLAGASSGSFSFDTDNGSAQSITVEGSGALSIGADLTADAGDTLILHAGAGGAGNLSFSGTPSLRADSIVLWAGIGDGTASSSAVDFTNKPVLANAAGTGAPGALVVRQDASIADAALSAANFQGGTLPTSYTLRSDGGDVTIATAGNVAGTNLTLQATHAGDAVTIAADFTGGSALSALSASGSTINIGGNVSTAGDQSYAGALVLNQTATLAGGNLTLSGTVQSQANQFYGLTLNAAGTSRLMGNVGGSLGSGNELGSLDVTGSLRLGNGGSFSLVTKNTGPADGHITLGGPVELDASTTLTGGGPAAVTFASTVNSQSGGHFDLSVNSAGLTWFQGDVGTAGGGALGGIHTLGGGTTELGNGGGITLQTGSPMTFDDAVVLGADTALVAASPNGDVTFNSTVDSATGGLWNLSINAANSVSFKGNVGTAGLGELGALSISGGGTIFLGNGGSFSLVTREAIDIKGNANGAQSLGGPVVLMANATLTAHTDIPPAFLGAGQGDVTLGAVSSQSGQNFGIAVDTPGVTWFQGGVAGGGPQQLGFITTDGQGGALELTKFGTGGGTVFTSGAQSYGDTVVSTGASTFQGGSLSFHGLNAGGADLTLISDGIDFLGGADSVQGSGVLRIRAASDSDGIVLGQAGGLASTLYLERTDLLALRSGFAGIIIGSSTGSGAITVASDSALEPVWFRDPVTIQSPNGTIAIHSPNPGGMPGLYGADNASLTLIANAITLRSSVMTNGNDILFNGNVLLDSGGTGFIDVRSWGNDGSNLASAGSIAGNITVTGTINDVSATLLRLLAASSGTSGNVDLQGAIGGGGGPLAGLEVEAADLRLHADISTSGAGNHILFSTSSVTLAGNANPATPTTITIDTDSSGGSADGGSFLASGAVNHLAGTGAVNLSIDTSATGGRNGGSLGFTGAVGGINALNDLTLVSGTGNIALADVTLDGNFFSSGRNFEGDGAVHAGSIALLHTGSVMLGDGAGGDGLFTAGNANITGNTILVGANAVVSGGAVAFTDSAGVTINGGVSAPGGFTSGGGGTFGLASGASISTSGANISITRTGLVSLSGTIDAGSGHIAISSAGIDQLAGSITGSSLALGGSGTFSLAMSNSVGTLAANITGPLTFVNSSSLTVGTIGSLAGISTGNGSLSLAVDGGTLSTVAPIDSGTGDITLAGPAISATGGISGGSVQITSTGSLAVGSITTTVGSIVLTAPGVTSIGGSFTSAGDFTAGAIDLSGNTFITTSGANGIALGDVTGVSNIVLTSHNVGRIVVGAIGASGQHMGNVTFQSATTVQLNGDIFGNDISFMDDITGASRDVPTAATIFRDGSLTITADGDFTMEQNQKLAVHDSLNDIGDLSILTNGGTITIGDLSALGRIVLDTGSVNGDIRILARDSARVLLPTGSLSSEVDKGTDIVSAYTGADPIHMRGTVEIIGGSNSRHVQFAAQLININAVAGQLNYLPATVGFIVPVNTPDSFLAHEADFLSGSTVLDLVAKGNSGLPPSSLQGALVPREVQLITLERGTALTGAIRDALRELGIYARDVRTDEILEYLIGRALYDDVPYKLDPSPTDNQVASNRLPYLPVLPTVDAYRNLFFKPELDAQGVPVMENGKPKLVTQDQAILTTFGQSWLAYKREKQDDATPGGFRGYLEAHEGDDPKFAAALDNLNQLRDLLARIKELGLTDTEFDVSQKVILAKVRPANIREEDFLAVVTGPSSRGR